MSDLELVLLNKLKSGGGGGTSDYNDLTNKPRINSVSLADNKSSHDLGLQSEITLGAKLSADLVDDSSTANKFVDASEKASIGTSATKLTGVAGSASNYIQLTNGKRIYLDDTEPTGNDIPEGSVWLGGAVSS